MKKRIAGIAAAGALLAAVSSTSAQERSSTRGIVLGAHVNASAVQLDEEDGGEAERGVGAGLKIGYGVSDRLALFVRGDVANIAYAGDDEGSFVLGNVDLGGRFSFGTSAAELRPYAELGLSGTAVSDEVAADNETVDVVLSGAGLLLGGGVEYFFSRRSALDVGLGLGKGRLTSAEVNGETAEEFEDLDFTTIRLNLGITLRL